MKTYTNCVDCNSAIEGEGQVLIRCDECLFNFILNYRKGK